jgi:hypothetical protein
MYTLTVGLASAQAELCADQRARLPDGAGGVRLDPDLIVYVIFQKQIVGAMSGTAAR